MATDLSFLSQPAEEVAPLLLGWRLVRTIDGKTLEGCIVETEAYDQRDAASHSFKGKTARTEIMFGPAGHLYVYFTYGMHYCCNIVTGREGEGSAVLLRALEPIRGEEVMEGLRDRIGVEVANGPAKLCQAFAIDKRLNGHDLDCAPLRLLLPVEHIDASDVQVTTRVGISKDTHRLWRFYIKDNQYISRA